ncbi:MAG: acyl-CoA dehydrogenase family protein [Holophagales bacterium]|jgi:alkylation response protein AidB-like acyl-CoA dehydrogenase|nr:acyl-CoA dehydrogenase family protein [Holophagales bacterium]
MSQNNKEQLGGGIFLVSPVGAFPQFTPEELSDDAKAIGQAARDFVEGEILPNDSAIDKLDLELSKKLIRMAWETGLLSLEIPEEFEGMDLDKLTCLVVLEEVGRQASFSVTYGAHTGIGTLPIVYFGTPEQKAAYLPKLASGEWIAAYALTEAGAGSDAMNAKTVAALDGEHWILNGSKMWITNAGLADVFVVFAKVDGKKFSAFIVEKTDPGFSLGAEEMKLGIKGSSTRALIFENCRIPKERLLGRIGFGHRIAFGILAIGRFKLGAGCNGIAKEVLKYTLKYASERVQFGKAINNMGLIRQKLSDIAMRIYVAESINYRTVGYINEQMHSIAWTEENAASRKMEVMEEFQIEASLMKVWDSEALGIIADDSVQVFGGYGFSSEYPPEKIYRDNRINRLFEGTNEINRMIIAGQIFKKCGNETLNLRNDAADLPAMGTDCMAWASHAVALAKRRFQYSTAAALGAIGQKLIENQEASARVADMAMEIYAMESAVVRASKMKTASHRWSDFACDMANVFVNETVGKIRNNASILLAEALEGESLQKAIKELAAFDAFVPISSAKLRDRVAGELIEAGAYPIDQF